MPSNHPKHMAADPEYNVEALRILSNIPDISIYVTDYHTGEILMCNKTYAEFYNKSPESIVGTLCYEHLGYTSRCPFCKWDQLLDEHGVPTAPYTWEHCFEAYSMVLQITNQAIRWVDGRLANISIGVNITHRKQMENMLHNLAFFDQTLQIPNHELMKQDIRDNDSYDCLVAVQLADIDQLSNMFGIAYSDMILRTLLDYIVKMEIPGCTVYRGRISDLLLLFERDREDKELPVKIAKKIHERCRKPWEALENNQPQNMFLTANVGVLWMDFTHEHFLSYLYNLTIHSLDISHKTDLVVICDSHFRQKYDSGIMLELSLKSAVRESMRGFHVMYQPIVDMQSSKWHGIEALCRWDSPEFGSVPPDIFIPMAEAGGLINAIGLWVLEQSIIQSKRLKLDELKGFMLSVNLSPLQLVVPDLDRTITEILKKHDFSPENLGLEITESNELNFSKPTMEAISKLNDAGVEIILDDFGTGYSSFSTLHKLPAKILKADRSLVTGVESDSYLQNLVRIMVELAHGSGMKIVAEGVENDLQAQYLLEKNVDFIQGYFYSHPLSPSQLEANVSQFHTLEKPISK